MIPPTRIKIPPTHIKFSDDGTKALLVVSANEAADIYGPRIADRPCDGCDGRGWLDFPERKHGVCHGSGRPCFDITVRTECTCERRTIGGGSGWYDHATDCPVRSIKGYLASDGWHFVRTLTVSVVPGMVLGPLDDGQFVGESDYWYEEPNILRHFHDDQNDITLPSAAAVGKFAVQLNVHTPIEGDDQ